MDSIDLTEIIDLTYVEPFVGGGNLISHVPIRKRIGYDKNQYTIAALKQIRDNPDLIPKNNSEFTEEAYNDVKKAISDHPDWLVGMCTAYSFSGKFFGGWARVKNRDRDFVAEAYRNAQKQSKLLKHIDLFTCSYEDIVLDTKSVIYCDPPYEATVKYKTDPFNSSFNHDRFYDWCRDKHADGHIVLVSEYSMPDDFKCIWSTELKVGVDNLAFDSRHDVRVEKVFKLG